MEVSDAPVGAETITEELVAALGKSVGLVFPVERLPAITQRLREMHMIGAQLEGLDLTAFEPVARYDASWPEGEAR